MKTPSIFLTLLVILLFCSHGLASNSLNPPVSNTITGFGKFKIGKTTIQELKGTDTTFSWFLELDNRLDSTTGLGIEPSDYDYDFSVPLIYGGTYYGKNVKMGLVKEYRILEKNVSLALVFYKDTLVQLITEDFGDEIQEQWILKYGKGVLTERKKTITCTSRFGKYNESESYYTTTWGLPSSKVMAVYEFSEYYDSKCEKTYNNYLIVKSPSKMKKVEAISQKYSLSVINKIAEKKKREANSSDL
jgi:hypothetical protein